MKHGIMAVAVALGLGGCASTPPTTYLVLSPTRGPVYAAEGGAVAVGRVTLPATVDRSFLTTGNGENTLDISYNAQWAAPLEAMAQTTLARDLATRLPEHKVLMPGDNVPSNALVVVVNAVTFMPYQDRVVLEADWSAAKTTTKAAFSGRVNIVVPSSAAANNQAQAMSQALGILSDKIAQQVADEGT